MRSLSLSPNFSSNSGGVHSVSRGQSRQQIASENPFERNVLMVSSPTWPRSKRLRRWAGGRVRVEGGRAVCKYHQASAV